VICIVFLNLSSEKHVMFWLANLDSFWIAAFETILRYLLVWINVVSFVVVAWTFVTSATTVVYEEAAVVYVEIRSCYDLISIIVISLLLLLSITTTTVLFPVDV
jgi:hypothetical protein